MLQQQQKANAQKQPASAPNSDVIKGHKKHMVSKAQKFNNQTH